MAVVEGERRGGSRSGGRGNSSTETQRRGGPGEVEGEEGEREGGGGGTSSMRWGWGWGVGRGWKEGGWMRCVRWAIVLLYACRTWVRNEDWNNREVLDLLALLVRY
jgi:hypothetical protein